MQKLDITTQIWSITYTQIWSKKVPYAEMRFFFCTHVRLYDLAASLAIIIIITSGNHRLESAGLNTLEELLRCWEWTEKIEHVYFEIGCF